MRLCSLHIENFGKISNFDISFEDGLNQYVHENGWGKTTLATFVKVCIYGFDNETKRTDRERDKYRPWQGGVYGGTLEFETKGKRYRVYRTFGLKASEDNFKLIDSATGLISQDFTENLGEELFGINRDSFFRTAYLSQEDSESYITDDIRARMGGISQAVDDIGRYERADKKLSDVLNKNTFQRKTGLGKQLEQRLADYKNEYDSYRNADEDLEKLQGLRDAEKKKEEHVLKESNELGRLQEKYEHFEVTDEERNKKISVEKAGYNTYSEDDINEKIDALNKCDGGYLKYQQERGVLLDRLGEMQKSRPLEVNTQTDRLGIIAGVLLVVGLVTLALYFIDRSLVITALGGALVIAGAVLLIISFNNNKATRAEKSEYEKAIFSWNEENNAVRSKIDELDKASAEISDMRDRMLKELNASDGGEALKKLYAIRDDLREYERILVKEENYDKAFEEYSKAAEGTEIGGIRKELDRLDNVIDDYDEQIKVLEENIRRRDELDSLIAETKRQSEELKEHLRLIELTKKYLTDAKDAFTQKFTDPVLGKFKEYMASCGIDEKYSIDAHMDIYREEAGMPRGIDTQSRGLKDLQCFAQRLAFSECCYADEKPFIIMDDPFTNMDDGTVVLALKLIEALAERMQIIYFTCSESRKQA